VTLRSPSMPPRHGPARADGTRTTLCLWKTCVSVAERDGMCQAGNRHRRRATRCRYALRARCRSEGRVGLLKPVRDLERAELIEGLRDSENRNSRLARP